MLIVTGVIRSAPEQAEHLLAAALAHVHRSRSEPGCIEHRVHRDCEDPARLFFFERWASREALQAHFDQEGSKAFMREMRALASERDGPHVWEVRE